MTEQDKVTVDDIIGIVKTEEQTNSVEEVRKLRGRGNETAKRFMVDDCGTLIDIHTRDTFDYVSDVCGLLNELNDECKVLEIENKSLEDGVTRYVELYHESLKENEQLKIALKDKENLISICEKKFKELEYLITCDDDGYVIE